MNTCKILFLALYFLPSLSSPTPPPSPAARDRRARGASCTRSSNATGSYDEIALRAICRSERYNAYPTSLRGESEAAEHTHSSMRTRDSAEQCCGSRYDMIDETYLTAEELGS